MKYAMHGESRTPEYYAWQAMKKRCLDKNDSRYKDYGGRGITFADEWISYEKFKKDLGSRPSNQHSLERIDNNQGYCKENCRWATKKEQSRNMRRNHFIFFSGQNLTIAEWAEKTGLHKSAILARLKYGWSIEKTLTTPSQRHKTTK